jgi:hypothetical protein
VAARLLDASAKAEIGLTAYRAQVVDTDIEDAAVAVTVARLPGKGVGSCQVGRQCAADGRRLCKGSVRVELGGEGVVVVRPAGQARSPSDVKAAAASDTQKVAWRTCTFRSVAELRW